MAAAQKTMKVIGARQRRRSPYHKMKVVAAVLTLGAFTVSMLSRINSGQVAAGAQPPEPADLHPVYKQQVDMFTKFLNTAFPAGAADAAKQTHGSCKLCVDVVIGWSGPPDPGSGKGSSIRDRDNGEMIFLLRSIALNAPYAHHIFILVNTAQMAAPSVVNPDWIPRSIRDKTSIIDRCKHMPTGSCPTKNSMSVQTFAHHIPNLMEHYIIAEVGGLLS